MAPRSRKYFFFNFCHHKVGQSEKKSLKSLCLHRFSKFKCKIRTKKCIVELQLWSRNNQEIQYCKKVPKSRTLTVLLVFSPRPSNRYCPTLSLVMVPRRETDCVLPDFRHSDTPLTPHWTHCVRPRSYEYPDPDTLVTTTRVPASHARVALPLHATQCRIKCLGLNQKKSRK